MNHAINELDTYCMLGQEYVRLSNVHPVRLSEHLKVEAIGMHQHAFTELGFVQVGQVPHRTLSPNGEVQSEMLEPGNVVIVPKGPFHGYGHTPNGEECTVTNLVFLPEWFLWDLNLLRNEGVLPLFFASQLFRRAEALQIWKVRLSEDELLACEREMADIQAEYSRPTPSLLFVRCTFFKILLILARAWQREFPQHQFHFRPEVWRAMQIIDSCIQEGRNFRVDTFTREAGFAPGTFTRFFQNATGLSPKDYFSQRRAQHAAHLLLDSDFSVSAIASKLGFADASHLTRSFSRHQGMSPNAFRKLYRL